MIRTVTAAAVLIAAVAAPLGRTANDRPSQPNPGQTTTRAAAVAGGCASGVSAAFAAAHGTTLCAAANGPVRTATPNGTERQRLSAGQLHQQTERALGGKPDNGARTVATIPSSVIQANTGFAWGSALIGATIAAGVLLFGAAGAITVRRRKRLAHP